MPLFHFFLISAVSLRDRLAKIPPSALINDRNIEKFSLAFLSETSSTHILPCIWFFLCTPVIKCFVCLGIKQLFNCSIAAYLGNKSAVRSLSSKTFSSVSSKVHVLVLPEKSKSEVFFGFYHFLS